MGTRYIDCHTCGAGWREGTDPLCECEDEDDEIWRFRMPGAHPYCWYESRRESRREAPP